MVSLLSFAYLLSPPTLTLTFIFLPSKFNSPFVLTQIHAQPSHSFVPTLTPTHPFTHIQSHSLTLSPTQGVKTKWIDRLFQNKDLFYAFLQKFVFHTSRLLMWEANEVRIYIFILTYMHSTLIHTLTLTHLHTYTLTHLHTYTLTHSHTLYSFLLNVRTS